MLELSGSTALYTLPDLFVDLRGEKEIQAVDERFGIVTHTPGAILLTMNVARAPWKFESASHAACLVDAVDGDSATHQFRIASESEDPWKGEVQFSDATGRILTQQLDFQLRRSSLFVLTLCSLAIALSLTSMRRKRQARVEG